MENKQNSPITAKQFLKYIILKYPENRDFLQMLNSWQNAINTLVRSIIKERDFEIEEFKLQVLQDPHYSDIDFYLEWETPFNRVKVLLFLLKNVIVEVFKSEDEYFENRKILEDAFESYKYSFSTKSSDDDIVTDILNNNQLINLNKFGVLFDTGAAMANQCTALAARTGVGKTVFSVNLIKDLVESNNEICVLYFWTPEVNKANFHKRMMMMTSNEPIWEILKEISKNQDKEKNLEKIIALFEMDKSQSIKYLINNLQSKKYYMLYDEKMSLKDRISMLEEKIQQLTTQNNAVADESANYMKKKFKSEISSLNLKLKANAKSMLNYLKADESLLKIVQSIFNKLLTKPNFISLGNALTSDDMDLIYGNFIDKWYNHTSEYLLQHYPIEKVLEAIWNVEDFLKSLLSKGSDFYDDELKNEVKQEFESHLYDVHNHIATQRALVKEESNKVLDFLAKEHVEIEDNLNISRIENRIRETRKRFPNHKLVFVIDYQQKVEWLPNWDRSERAEYLGKLINDYAVKYNAFWIAMSQLNDIKASEWTLKYTTRPRELKVRDGEGMIQWVGTAWIIFNRNMFNYPENASLPIESVDLNFVIYEMYLTKNRYGLESYFPTRQYFIFDKKKMSYLPIARKWYQVLDKERELLYLDQLLQYLKDIKSEDITFADIIE